MLGPKPGISDETYIEFVQNLFDTVVTTAIMACWFLAVGILFCVTFGDRLLILLTALGAAGMGARLIVLLGGRRAIASAPFGVAEARRWERRFGYAYLAFAVALGSFCVHAFLIGPAEARAVIAALLFGYGAGAALAVSFRPRISVSALIIAVVPTMAASLILPNPFYRMLGGMLAVFMAGGVHSMFWRFRHAGESVTLKNRFALLARSDALTGLANRLALAERFQTLAEQVDTRTVVAVHCIDLDGFKAVNDRHGHPVGDQLLQAVSERLTKTLRATDFLARTGGDEFVVMQAGVSDPSEADLLARRICRVLGEPYAIGDRSIVIGASVGYTLRSEHAHDLDALIHGADDALLLAKIRRGTSVRGEMPHGLARAG